MQNKPKVLCVDDESINLLILRKILGKRNFDVVIVERGQAALEALEADPDINLIITDMHMPGMTGLEFVQKAQQQFENKTYFMLSGYAITEETQQALDAKLITEYFEKPPDFSKIVKALQAVLDAPQV